MKHLRRVLLILLILSVGLLLEPHAHGQSTQAPGLTVPSLTCSPAPCVLPPTQASEGGGTVTDPLIVANPLDQTELLVGSGDFNCNPSALGFHLSRNGGSTWQRAECMPEIVDKQGRIWDPGSEPSVAYDRTGTAYIAGQYFCSAGYLCNDYNAGFVAVQRSTDGTHWSKPIVALRHPGQTYPVETALTVDTNAGSSGVNRLYVSGVMEQGGKGEIVVSHSTDGGVTWTQVAVDPVQTYPEEDDFTRLAVGKDGTVYVTWLHCRGKSGSGGALCPTVHTMFSKSTDGGNTWSSAQRIATVAMPHYWLLPNTKYGERVYNYPVIGVDNGNRLYSGSLYVAMYSWTGTYMRVQVIRSTDDGKTWSQPVPLAPKTDTHDQFFPAISVSPSGLVGVSWLDRRNDPGNHKFQAFAAFSNDGGKRFNRNWQLTKAFSDPDVGGPDGFMGDYTGNTWSGGNFIAAWMDSSNGTDMQEVIGGIRLH